MKSSWATQSAAITVFNRKNQTEKKVQLVQKNRIQDFVDVNKLLRMSHFIQKRDVNNL